MTIPITVRRIAAEDYGGFDTAFTALCRRADAPNLHMAPAAVAAALKSGRVAGIVVLGAFSDGEERRLLGVWALHRIRTPMTGFVTVLEAPLVPLYEVSSAPVLDRDHAASVAAALLAFIASTSGLPNILRLPVMPVAGAAFDALRAACAASGSQITSFESWERPMMTPAKGEDAEAYLRRALGGGYKKRMQQHRMLERAGRLSFHRHRGAEAVAELETFLTLEAAGWKGANGTALARLPGDVAYFRDLVARFAAIDGARIDILRLDGAAIAAGVLLDLAGQAHFLKIAYDEGRARLSPGRALAIEMLRADLASGTPGLLDSGAGDRVDAGTYVWGERQPMANLLVALGGQAATLPRLAGEARMRLRDWRHRRQSTP